ncbi:hypothetical protein AB1N83_009431 [Pleurotus pulmonarius]
MDGRINDAIHDPLGVYAAGLRVGLYSHERGIVEVVTQRGIQHCFGPLPCRRPCHVMSRALGNPIFTLAFRQNFEAPPLRLSDEPQFARASSSKLAPPVSWSTQDHIRFLAYSSFRCDFRHEHVPIFPTFIAWKRADFRPHAHAPPSFRFAVR